MLHGLQTTNSAGEDWRVLVVDDITVKVFSSVCKLSDVAEESVSRACPALPLCWPSHCAALSVSAHGTQP